MPIPRAVLLPYTQYGLGIATLREEQGWGGMQHLLLSLQTSIYAGPFPFLP